MKHKFFFVYGPDGELATVAAADDSQGSYQGELQALRQKLEPVYGPIDIHSGFVIISKHVDILQEPTIVVSQPLEKRVKADMQYRIARDFANDKAVIQCRHWEEDEIKWSGWYPFGSDISPVPWNKRLELANHQEYIKIVAKFTKPEPDWPKEHGGYYAITDDPDQQEWLHIHHCCLEAYFGGRRDVLVAYMSGESTRWTSDDGHRLYTLHEDSIQFAEKPLEFTRWLKTLRCKKCHEKIV